MVTYRFICPCCDGVHDLPFRMDDTEGRREARCPGPGPNGGPCGVRLHQDYRNKQIVAKAGWREFTHYDLLPDDMKGAGPHSKVARDYAARTWPSRGGRWL